MKVEALYNPMLVLADTWEPLAEVASRMRFNEVGSAAVFEEGELAGIITERDLSRALADKVDADIVTVADYMTHQPAVVTPQTDVRQAALNMLDLGVRHMPVVSRGRLVGMLSIRDVLLETIWGASQPAGVK